MKLRCKCALYALASVAIAFPAEVVGQEALTFEVEHYTEPKTAWQVDRFSDNKWNLWSTDRNAKQKWSGGVVFQSPRVMADRKTPEEGAPVLHTKITGIPKGKYNVELTTVGRGLAISLDAGKTWMHKRDGALGIHEITDGVFELWVDDRYAHPDVKSRGSSYYDAIVFTPVIEAKSGVINGGFELAKDGKPAGWGMFSRTKGALTAAVVEGEKHAGERCLRVEHTGERDWAATCVGRFSVKGGEFYTLSAWIKLESGSGPDLAAVRYGGGNRRSWGMGRSASAKPGGWVQVQNAIRIREGTDSIQVRFTGSKPGKFWIDDVALRPGKPAPRKKPKVMGHATERVKERLDRGLVAMRMKDGVYVGWRLLDSDAKGIAFNLYRAEKRGEARRLNEHPIAKTTDFVDTTAQTGIEYTYHVRPVLNGREGKASRPVPICGARGYVSIKLDGDHTFQKTGIGDLDGDGRYDYVIKQPNKNIDPYIKYWYKSPETYKVEAYGGDGKFLWRHDLGWSIERGIWYSPMVVQDFDGDGKAEVAVKTGVGDPRDEDGHVRTGAEFVSILDGMTGKEVTKAPWPSREGFRSLNHASRNQLGVAYLDGKTPCLIVERGTYGTIKVDAYEFVAGRLRKLWAWDNREEPSWYRGQGAHALHVGDVDNDGRDEVVIGSACIDDNGVGLWSTGLGHPDHHYMGDIDPTRPGMEIYYGMETRNQANGCCLVDAATGKIIWGWDQPTRHVHASGMCADIDPAHPGLECYSSDTDARKRSKVRWLRSAKGEMLRTDLTWGFGLQSAYWDADPQREILRGGHMVDYAGGQHEPRIEGRIVAFADVLGDWREELIVTHAGELRIYTTTIPAADRRVCLMQDHVYRMCVVVEAMGYTKCPMTSYCISADRAGLALRFESERLRANRVMNGSVVVTAPATGPLAGEVTVASGPGASVSPTQCRVDLKPGQVKVIPIKVTPSVKPSALTGQATIGFAAELKAGGETMRTDVSLPIADEPLKGAPMAQAEAFVAQGGGKVHVRTDKKGSVGDAISHWDNEQHWLEWKIAAPKAGAYYLVVRYCAPHEALRSLLVDNQALPGVELLRFPSTGSFGSAATSAWAHAVVRNADGAPNAWRLKAGAHTIRMENVDGKGLNLDYVAFVPAD